MDKEEWVIEYLKNKSALEYVDMLDEKFISAFSTKFDAKVLFMGLGAPKCKELSVLLASMYKRNLLERFAHGVPNRSQDGRFPKWVYSYQLIKR